MQIEKAINSGTVLVLYNIGQQIDSLLMPLIHHINTAVPDKPFKGKKQYRLLLLYETVQGWNHCKVRAILAKIWAIQHLIETFFRIGLKNNWVFPNNCPKPNYKIAVLYQGANENAAFHLCWINAEYNLDKLKDIVHIVSHTQKIKNRYPNSINISLTDVQIVKFGSRRVTCSPKFRLYLVSRASEPVFSTEVASITTLINFELRDQGLGEELALEAFARVRPELYIEGRKCLLAVVELLKILEDVDSKLMNRIMTKEGTSIWDETELIAELVQCRTEVSNKILYS